MVETKSQKAMRSRNLPKNIMDKIEKGGKILSICCWRQGLWIYHLPPNFLHECLELESIQRCLFWLQNKYGCHNPLFCWWCWIENFAIGLATSLNFADLRIFFLQFCAFQVFGNTRGTSLSVGFPPAFPSFLTISVSFYLFYRSVTIIAFNVLTSFYFKAMKHFAQYWWIQTLHL